MALIRNPKDFWAGVLFVAFGTAAMVIGGATRWARAARMGPGYFPRMLGFLLIVSRRRSWSLRALKLRGAPLQMRNLKPLADRAGQRRSCSAWA